jgi:serpin B
MRLTRLRNLSFALAAGLLAVLTGALAFALETDPPAPPQPPKAAVPVPQPAEKAVPLPKATPADVAAAVEGNTHFALDLYGRLRSQKGNLFLSPSSISTALAMTYAGARGDTAEEMEKTLHFTLGQQKLHPAMAELTRRLKPGKASKCRLSIANALWGQSGFGFLPEFLALNRDLYGAPLHLVDFAGATEEARKTINAWVEKQTEKKVKDLLQPGILNGDARLVLTNAVYFNAAWERPFDKKLTRGQSFSVTPDLKVQVPMMNQNGPFRYLADEELQVLELAYKGKELSLLVLLPQKVDGLPELEKRLTTANLKKWLAGLREGQVWVSLPKFECTSAFQLNQVLKDMGMPLAFRPGGADFSGMNGNRKLYIQAAVHKAFVTVNEVGTEAAAATAVVVGQPSAPPIFRADHPFLFLIRDNRSGSVLFLGRLADPR